MIHAPQLDLLTTLALVATLLLLPLMWVKLWRNKSTSTARLNRMAADKAFANSRKVPRR